MDSLDDDFLRAIGKTGKSVMVRAVTAQIATDEVQKWATENGRTVFDVSEYYESDLRGESFVGGDPLISGNRVPDWVLAVMESDRPSVLLLPNLVAMSAQMSETNVSVLRTAIKDRRFGGSKLPRDCFIAVTAAVGEGTVPGLSGDSMAHLVISRSE